MHGTVKRHTVHLAWVPSAHATLPQGVGGQCKVCSALVSRVPTRPSALLPVNFLSIWPSFPSRAPKESSLSAACLFSVISLQLQHGIGEHAAWYSRVRSDPSNGKKSNNVHTYHVINAHMADVRTIWQARHGTCSCSCFETTSNLRIRFWRSSLLVYLVRRLQLASFLGAQVCTILATSPSATRCLTGSATPKHRRFLLLCVQSSSIACILCNWFSSHVFVVLTRRLPFIAKGCQ